MLTISQPLSGAGVVEDVVFVSDAHTKELFVILRCKILSFSSVTHVMTLQVCIVTQIPTQKNSFVFPGRKGQLPPNATTTVFQFRRRRHWELRSRYRSLEKNLQRQSALPSSGASAQVEETSGTDEYHQDVCCRLYPHLHAVLRTCAKHPCFIANTDKGSR